MRSLDANQGHYTSELADGGAGLICFSNIPIHRDNLENYNNAVLDPNNPWNALEAFAPAIKAAKSRGAICLPQLQFPGRQVPEFLNKNPKSSSDHQLEPCLNKTYGKPEPLTKSEIKDLVRRYVWAAEVLAKAGADGIVGCSPRLARATGYHSYNILPTDHPRYCSFTPVMDTS